MFDFNGIRNNFGENPFSPYLEKGFLIETTKPYKKGELLNYLGLNYIVQRDVNTRKPILLIKDGQIAIPETVQENNLINTRLVLDRHVNPEIIVRPNTNFNVICFQKENQNDSSLLDVFIGGFQQEPVLLRSIPKTIQTDDLIRFSDTIALDSFSVADSVSIFTVTDGTNTGICPSGTLTREVYSSIFSNYPYTIDPATLTANLSSDNGFGSVIASIGINTSDLLASTPPGQGFGNLNFEGLLTSVIVNSNFTNSSVSENKPTTLFDSSFTFTSVVSGNVGEGSISFTSNLNGDSLITGVDSENDYQVYLSNDGENCYITIKQRFLYDVEPYLVNKTFTSPVISSNFNTVGGRCDLDSRNERTSSSSGLAVDDITFPNLNFDRLPIVANSVSYYKLNRRNLRVSLQSEFIEFDSTIDNWASQTDWRNSFTGTFYQSSLAYPLLSNTSFEQGTYEEKLLEASGITIKDSKFYFIPNGSASDEYLFDSIEFNPNVTDKLLTNQPVERRIPIKIVTLDQSIQNENQFASDVSNYINNLTNINTATANIFSIPVEDPKDIRGIALDPI